MSGDDRQASVQWAEALLWLAKADEDLAAGQILLTNRLYDPAAFHVQQALEKVLKALLIAAFVDVSRTHDIDALAARVRQHWPDVLPSPFSLAAVSQWYITSRYPEIDQAAPTSSEISQALASVGSLLKEVRSRAGAMTFLPPGAADIPAVDRRMGVEDEGCRAKTDG